MNNDKLQMDKLQMLEECMPYFIELVSSKINIGLYNKEECLASFVSEDFDLGVRKGQKILAKGVTNEAMKNAKKISKEIPKDVLGIPYIASSMPVIGKNNEVIGAITVAESIENKKTIINMADELSAAMQQITATMQEVASVTEGVAELGANIEELAEKNFENVKQTDEVLRFIYDISKQTKLLGLNASIEAARAGAAGKTFGIVANEISKLAESSGDSTKKSNDILDMIKNENINMMNQSKDISLSLKKLTESTQEISFAIQSLNSLAMDLLNLSQNIQTVKV